MKRWLPCNLLRHFHNYFIFFFFLKLRGKTFWPKSSINCKIRIVVMLDVSWFERDIESFTRVEGIQETKLLSMTLRSHSSHLSKLDVHSSSFIFLWHWKWHWWMSFYNLIWCIISFFAWGSLFNRLILCSKLEIFYHFEYHSKRISHSFELIFTHQIIFHLKVSYPFWYL